MQLQKCDLVYYLHIYKISRQKWTLKIQATKNLASGSTRRRHFLDTSFDWNVERQHQGIIQLRPLGQGQDDGSPA